GAGHGGFVDRTGQSLASLSRALQVVEIFREHGFRCAVLADDIDCRRGEIGGLREYVESHERAGVILQHTAAARCRSWRVSEVHGSRRAADMRLVRLGPSSCTGAVGPEPAVSLLASSEGISDESAGAHCRERREGMLF